MVGLARTGDRDAFAELVRTRQGWIRSLMRKCCGDITLADDLAQQTFLQAWRDIGKLRQPDKFAAWLKRLAINKWLQHVRADKEWSSEPVSEHLGEQGESQSVSVHMDLNQALSKLPGPVRLCVVLCYHEGMSHAEISQLTELPSGTVKSHIRRGSERLREMLAAYRPDPEGEAP